MKKNKILVIGSSGQIGTDLYLGLERIYGAENIICSDLNPPKEKNYNKNFIKLDVLDNEMLTRKVIEENISEIYLLAASLSALAEKNVLISWELNMNSLINVLELARKKIIKKIFWPSSIAVFGPDSPKLNTPQNTILNPSSIYGITKLAGEKLCKYYYDKFDVDIRSLRLPGLIGWRSLAGGGTTDYAVEIFYYALNKNDYTCFLSEETTLPMMYMDDAIEAILNIMTTKKENIKIRTSYNISAGAGGTQPYNVDWGGIDINNLSSGSNISNLELQKNLVFDPHVISLAGLNECHVSLSFLLNFIVLVM